MDIIKLSERLGNISLGDVADGELVTRINDKLPEDKIVRSNTTGTELKDLYMSLEIDEQKELDKLFTVAPDHEFLADLLGDIAYTEARLRLTSDQARDTRYMQSIVLLAIVLLVNTINILSYHAYAISKLHDVYHSDVMDTLSTLFSIFSKIVGLFIN